ncbi:hypothetical protein, partial [Salinivibrio sp. MA427]|uniref:hypothetical protein n=1 Tax=Salinivibrio sp. MA427 TaxID=1909455 RepID=UPI001A7E4937
MLAFFYLGGESADFFASLVALWLIANKVCKNTTMPIRQTEEGMAGNTIGQIFRVTTFGESHGVALGAII